MKNSLSRFKFLRGLQGSVLGLPMLEAFSQEVKVAKRMVHFYVPIGVVRKGFFPGEQDQHLVDFGNNGDKHSHRSLKEITKPVGEHPLKISMPTLEPLQPMLQKTTLITGLDRVFQDGTDVHAQCASCYLSSAAPYRISNSAWPLDRTLDHVVADEIGSETPFKTLAFSCNPHQDMKESIYFDNISWYGTGHLAPSMRHPRKIYQRLFNLKKQDHREITSLVLADARSFKRRLSYADRHKLEEYFEGIRNIEHQMVKLEGMSDRLMKLKLREPKSSYLPRGQFIQVMADLMVAALQSGLTHVSTFMVAPERWDTPYLFDEISDQPMSHHKMSHHQSKYVETLMQVDRFHVRQFVTMLQKMDRIKELDGQSLLDHSLVTYGSGLGDGATHQYNDLPIIMAGGHSMGYRGGRHIRAPKGTPLANLWLRQAQSLGVERSQFADSTSTLNV